MLIPGTSAAASARRAASSSAAAAGSPAGSDISSPSASRAVASCAGSASPIHLSSGASRAITTARAAISAMVSGRVSEAETQACRCPISTLSPISVPSERSACSSRPCRTSIDSDTPRTAMASAASAPAAPAAASNASVRSESLSDMGRAFRVPVPEVVPRPRRRKTAAARPPAPRRSDGPEIGATTGAGHGQPGRRDTSCGSG